MNLFRSYVKDYIENQPIKAVKKFDFDENTITYNKRKDNNVISVLPGDEEVVRAFLVTKLVNEYGYQLEDIYFEKKYDIGRPKKTGARVDIIVYKPNSDDIFMFIEIKSPDKFKKERLSAIENQLFALAAQEINKNSNNIDYLVYYSVNELDFSDEINIIDYKKYNSFNLWKSQPDYYSGLLHSYESAPELNQKRHFGQNDVDSRIEGVISSVNQHLKYSEVKDSILFLNTCILSLFNDNFREEIINGMWDSKNSYSIIEEMKKIIVRSGGEIDNYSFLNNKNKKIVSELIYNTCSSMQSKQQLETDQIYSLLQTLKDISNQIFPIILYGTNEDKILVSETIYKYVYLHKSGKNSIISTPSNITNFMVNLLELEENDYFIEFCTGFGNFSLSYMLYVINNLNNQIKGTNISGIESEEYVYLFYITTLRIVGLNVIQAENGDMLNLSSIRDLIPSYNENFKIGACMNPPFGGKDNKIAAKLAIKGCQILPKGSLFAIILPYVFAIGSAKKDGFDAPKFHKDLLKNNTLLASFSLADGTFGATASTVVTVLLVETGIPHYQLDDKGKVRLDLDGNPIPRDKTFLMYCKDDGYKILKNKRVEIEPGIGIMKSNSWISDYKSKSIDPVKSVYVDLTEGDEWLVEAYMKTDYSTLSQTDFEQTVRSFLAYKIDNNKVEIK